MKSIVILGDGMADEPIEQLGGKTPLEVARKPNIDRIAREGRNGIFSTIPSGMPLGSAVANLSVLGYDPTKCYQGRAVLEAASMGVELGRDDVALRCNLITIADEKIKSHSAGHISTEEAAEIIHDLDQALGGGRGREPVTFHAGLTFKHLLVLRGGWAAAEADCAAPHDHLGENCEELLPKATAESAKARATAVRLVELYRKANAILADHPVNRKRIAAGHEAANAIWTWSPGRRPTMQTFKQRFGVQGAVISAVDLVMGLGVYAGMEVVHVPGATGLWDTNYEGKAEACLEALKKNDFVYVHVEATDEASHAKDVDLKIKCIEMLDSRLVGPILKGLEKGRPGTIVAVLPDHPTSCKSGAHTAKPVPFAIRHPAYAADSVQAYSETEAASGSFGLISGEHFIRAALGLG